MAGSSDNYQRDREVLYYAFTDPLIPDEKLTKPITSLDGLLEANRSLMLRVADFYDAYRNIEIGSASPIVLDSGAQGAQTCLQTCAAGISRTRIYHPSSRSAYSSDHYPGIWF